MTSVNQDLYLSVFERRNIKINRKCAALTRAFSQAPFLGQHQAFLTDLETSTELYERLAQGKQISTREERQIFSFSRLLDSFEEELDASQHSLSSTLCHRISTQPLEALSRYMGELGMDFTLHLVLDNHIVAIYRVGSTYAYFDSNVALVANLSSPTHLIRILTQAIKSTGYQLVKEGFSVEYFNVSKANKELSLSQRQTLITPIETEHLRLSL